MKRTLSIFLLLISIFSSCKGQSKYFKPSGIKDRTKELAGKNIWITLSDKESVDGYTRIGDSIFGGEISCNIPPLKNIDIKTFKVLSGTQYAKDTNHVYYPLEITCKDAIDCGVCYFGEIIVTNAIPVGFKYLSNDYATDGTYAFFRGRQIPGADGSTFKVVDGPEYFYFATDKFHVYKQDMIFPDADPFTFYYAKNDPRNITTKYNGKYIIGDKSKEWEFIPPNSIKEVAKK
jgi:hypothetical protein